MPYIETQDRRKYDNLIDDVVEALGKEWNAGDLNYIFSTICWRLFSDNKCYATANTLLGVVTGVQLEFYRIPVAAYEDEKKFQNGNIG
jgi:hypothetical protein